MHLKEGLWNGIWIDTGIKATNMNIGKGVSGIIGNTTKDRAVQIWANSHHLCGELPNELEGEEREKVSQRNP